MITALPTLGALPRRFVGRELSYSALSRSCQTARMPFRRKRALLAALVVAAGLGGWASTAGAGPALSVRHPALARIGATVGSEASTNWAGYAVTHPRSFSSVTGRWIQPVASCVGVSPTYSAFWVGLGGFAAGAHAVEQIGTMANCSAGSPYYTAWFELYPALPVSVKLRVRPRDKMSATVTVNGTRVLLRLKDVTADKLFTKTLRTRRPDLSSAEWIAEAPTGCDYLGNCSTLPLTNFGTIAFSHSSAAVKGHKGRISDPVWSATTIELHGDLDDPSHPSQAGANAIPGELGADGGSFTVSWQALAPPNS